MQHYLVVLNGEKQLFKRRVDGGSIPFKAGQTIAIDNGQTWFVHHVHWDIQDMNTSLPLTYVVQTILVKESPPVGPI